MITTNLQFRSIVSTTFFSLELPLMGSLFSSFPFLVGKEMWKGAQSMGHKGPWKTPMLISVPATSQSLIYSFPSLLQAEVVFISLQLGDHPFRGGSRGDRKHGRSFMRSLVMSGEVWRTLGRSLANPIQHSPEPPFSAKKGLPLPIGRGVCETKSKNGRSRPRKPFISRVCCAQRGIETMVSEGARPWGRGRSGDCDLSHSPEFQ